MTSFLPLPWAGAPGGVVAGGLVPAQPHHHDAVQRGVGLAVAAAVEAVPDGLAGGGLHRRGAAQRRERGLGAESRVRPDRDHRRDHRSGITRATMM
jgi:hypothetical protein